MVSDKSSPPAVVRRIGVYVDLDLVGDALIKLPFVAALRAAWPGAEIVWIAGVGPSAFGRGLAPLVEGLLDRVLEGTGVGDGLRRALGETRLDLLIDTQSTVATALALRRLGARRFVSAAAWGLVGVPPQVAPRAPRHLVRRLLALLERASGRGVAETFGLRLPAAIAAQAAGLLPAGEDYVALVLGAGGKHKVWPEAQHVGLARALLAEGRVPVFILGPDERDRHADLAAAVPGARFPLQEAGEAPPVLTIALGARCVGAVAADCGGGHMMAASGVPLVSLFGPTDPAKFAPWAATSRVLRAQAFGGTEMAAIPVAAVRAALDAIVRGPVA